VPARSGHPGIREWVNRASSNLRFPDWLREPQAAAQTLLPPRHRATVSHVNVPDPAVGAGHTADGRVRRDPSDQVRLRQIADEQAALRRVATLVARGAAPEEVFAAATAEVGRVLSADLAGMSRYEPDGAPTVVGAWGFSDAFPGRTRLSHGGRNVTSLVFETGRPARIDDYADGSGPATDLARELGVRTSVGVPIGVEGRLWGAVLVGYRRALPPADAEARLASFSELVATAIANTESRAALALVAEEQAALRRVATLVAHGVPPQEVFAAVTEEVGRLLPADRASMCRYEPDGTVTFVASWGRANEHFPLGSRWSLGGHDLATLVSETGRPARIDNAADSLTGPLAVPVREGGVRSAVGVPVIVEGRLWGVIAVNSSLEEPLSPDTETRLASFTELVATAIANADSRAELMASRARIVVADDEARRRIERDLHDGTQQQLVSLMLDVRTVQAGLRAVLATVPPELAELEGRLARIAERAESVFDHVREISHGIHPAILSEQGLTPALKALARRSAVPVELGLRTGRRLPDPVEVAAYYAVSEALTNAAKHARASAVHVELDTPEATLRLAIRDDGIGGADPARGSGLTGLRDRIEAVGGTLDVTSPVRGGTTLLIKIPV
jgi:signal transduction histidine kinase